MPITDLPPTPPAAHHAPGQLRRIPRRRLARVFGSLLFATFVCLGMLVGWHVFVGWESLSSYLVWNLALAWIPLVFARAAYRGYARRSGQKTLFVICALAWFFFFPNAPYITTDVVHIHDDHLSSSWFHLMCIMAYAWTGLSLGYVSLYLMQEIVRARYGRTVEYFFVLVMLGACTLGIYFGRFLRWNSWDILRIPVRYLRRGYYQSPTPDPGADASFLPMMFCFLLLSYGVLYSLTHLHEPENDGS